MPICKLGWIWCSMDTENCSKMYAFNLVFNKLLDSLKKKLIKIVSPSVSCQRAVGQAPNFEVDAYMECYAYGYPPPRLRSVFMELSGTSLTLHN